MAQVPSNWARLNSPALVQSQLYMRFVMNSLTSTTAGAFFTATNLSSTISSGTVQTITPTVIFHDDPAARIVTFSYFTFNAGSARTLTIRVTGIDGYGETRTEDIVISQAINLTRAYFTRFAYLAVTSVQLVSGTNVSSGGSDTLAAGIVLTAAVAGTAGTQANGASATHFKGFQLPIQPATNMSAVSITTLAQVEVTGMSIKHGIAATADWVYATPISRAGDFLIDNQFGIMVPDEDPVLVAVDGSAAPADDAVVGFLLHVQTNRGE